MYTLCNNDVETPSEEKFVSNERKTIYLKNEFISLVDINTRYSYIKHSPNISY